MSHDKESSAYRLETVRAAKGARGRAQHIKDYYHFSYYAFDCKTGSLRWKHDASDFQPEKPAHEVLDTPVNFKNDESHLLHLGEVDWRVFRKALLSQLPHSWQRREDTQFRLAHFDRRKRGSSELEDKLKQAIPTAHIPSLTDWTQTHSAQEHVMEPNTIIAHLAHGIEVIHLYTGRTICQLTLSGGLWSDVNGDGVIDNAVAFGSHAHAGTISDLDTSTTPKCFGHMSTGVPKSAELFNLTVCNPSHYDVYTSYANQKHVEAVHPVAVDKPEAGGVKDIVFFTSNGEVTSVDGHGALNWKAETVATWDPTHTSESIEEIKLLELHDGLTAQAPHNTFLLAVAPSAFAILEPGSGTVVQEIEFDTTNKAMLSSPVTVGDINGDGINDLVFITPDSILAYAVQRRPSSRLFSLIVGGLSVLILATIAANQVKQKDPAKIAKD